MCPQSMPTQCYVCWRYQHVLLHVFARIYWKHLSNRRELYYIINPQTPKVIRQPKTPKGWIPPPWIFAFPSEFFKNISHEYVFGVKKFNSDNEKMLFLLQDLENQGQTPFCMAFVISGCKHDTISILESILTFLRSRILKMLKEITWP